MVNNRGTKQRVQRFLEIVGNGNPTGSVLQETIAVSATMSISVEKWHSQIRLRILSRSRMRGKRRETEVPEERVPVVECLDGLVRITSKELAITHFVKGGTLPNVCSACPRVAADLEKSARMHTVRLMNNPAKGLKDCDKSAVAMLKKIDWHENVRQLFVNNDKKSREIGATWYESWHLSWVERRTYRTSIIERTTIGLCFSRHEAVQVCLTEELRHTETNPTCKIHEGCCTSHCKFETKILRWVTFVQVNLMSLAPTLRNLRTVHKRRQSGQSHLPAKQRKIKGARKRNILLTFGK